MELNDATSTWMAGPIRRSANVVDRRCPHDAGGDDPG